MANNERMDIDELVKLISANELAILKAIWDYFLQQKEWPKGKQIRRNHGRTLVEEVVSKFTPLLIQRQQSTSQDIYTLTLEGIYVVEGVSGPHIKLLLTYLEYLRERFKEDINFLSVSAKELGSAQNMTPNHLRIIGEFLKLGGPVALWGNSASALETSDWSVGVMSEIEILYEAASPQAYLREKMNEQINKIIEDIDSNPRQLPSPMPNSVIAPMTQYKGKDRWKIVEECGGGGQGKVYRVLDLQTFNVNDDIRPSIEAWIKELMSPYKSEQVIKDKFELFSNALIRLNQMYDPVNHGALKILHEPEDARNAERAEDRIKREMQAMSAMKHPNLLKIIDADSDGKWFVSQYHQKGTLDKNRHLFVGNFPKALRAFRPLVEGVSELHKKKIVHRDVKPQNVFIDTSDNLVLGDFGLVFYTDEKHTRISNTFENVGSRDWMPAWAMSMRIEDISPSFDVFSLGKLLWSMVSGKPILRLWYFEKEQFNLEALFPKDRFVKFANPLHRKCIVEDEKDCLANASELLEEVDKALSVIEKDADIISAKGERTCKVCGIGSYKLIVDHNAFATRNFGFSPAGTRTMKIFVCSHCGNVQLFTFSDGRNSAAWVDDKINRQQPDKQ